MWISCLFPTITEKRGSFELYIGSKLLGGLKKRKTTQSVVFLFLFYDGGLERTVQTNSPMECLSVRGFSAEKQVQLR